MDCPTYMTFFRTLTWWSISRPMCKNFTSLLSTLMSKVEFFCWLLFQAKLFALLPGKRWWCPLRLEIAPWGGRLSYSTVGTPLGMLPIPLPTLLKYKYKYKYEITPLGMFHPTLLKYKYKCYTNPICMIPIPTLLKQPLDSWLVNPSFWSVRHLPSQHCGLHGIHPFAPCRKSSIFVAPMNAFPPFLHSLKA